MLEIWSKNDRMRHIPATEWMMQKLDGDVRRRVQHIVTSLGSVEPGDERRHDVEETLRALCRAAERVAEVARRGRGGAQQPPSELAAHVMWSLTLAVNALGTIDPETAGRRLPFQTFERSSSEPLYAAVLSVLYRLKVATELARDLDPQLDERLLENLVALENPVDDRMRQPMA